MDLGAIKELRRLIGIEYKLIIELERAVERRKAIQRRDADSRAIDELERAFGITGESRMRRWRPPSRPPTKQRVAHPLYPSVKDTPKKRGWCPCPMLSSG